ncbi:MAG TPA: ABC transporter ATP-binding protein [Agrobacterium sp.]|nr:ABC transporter ATP-binding protein [Agrobacterium sp.]
MTNPILSISNLNTAFRVGGEWRNVVNDVSFDINAKETVAVVGESGSGKSVTAMSIMRLLSPGNSRVTGRIDFEGKDLLSLPLEAMQKIRGNRIGMIFQEPMTSLNPVLKIGQQITEVLVQHRGMSHAQAEAEAVRLLEKVRIPSAKSRLNEYPMNFSGGMRQRVVIAIALACDPKLLIADEPTTALDVTIQAQILKLLRDLQSRLNMSMLLITHDLGVVANIADEVAVIYQGEIMEAGTVDDIFKSPSHPYLKGLMAAVPHFDMKPGERLKALREITVDHESLVGKKTAAVNKTPGPLLTVDNISKTFTTRKSSWFRKGDAHATKAVNSVSFDIRRGECLGLVGESGSGKTTVSKILMRAVRPDEGSVTFHRPQGDIDVLNAKDGDLKELRSKIQMVFQDPISSLSPRMTVGNILSEPLQIHGRGDAKYRAEKVRNLVKAIGLGESALNRYPHSFSGGQRQRIGIARALALGPELLICDEPVSALDVSVQAQILNLLKDLQKDLGLTYLFISHNLAVVDYMADRVAVMCEGRIVELAPREVMMRSPVHPYTKSLLAAVPFPDLDRPLDFRTIGKISATGKFDWGKQFRDEGDGEMISADLGDGHFVLANGNADIRELRP